MVQTGKLKASSICDTPGLRSRSAMRCALAIAVMFLLPGVGCGKGGINRNAIGGTVRCDGQPLDKGAIRLSPIKGTKGPVTGGPIENGRYQLPRDIGPVEGWYRIAIHTTRKTGKMVAAPFAQPGKEAMIEEYGEGIASRFNSESTLEVEVKPGDNTADFEVATK